MIIQSFTATKVHGYLDFNIKFKEDINFLVGHNGSGKTTALKLITAALTPNLYDLAKTPFESCYIEFIDSKTNKVSSIKVSKNDFSLLLSTSLSSKFYEYEIKEILDDEDFYDSELKDISKLANPVLISLDRKFNAEKFYKHRNTIHFKGDQIFPRDLFFEGEEENKSLIDIKRLIRDEILRIERRKSIEDAKLKDKILLDAFSIIESNNDEIFSISAYENAQLSEKRDLIKSTIHTLNLNDKNLKGVQQATDNFFYEINKNINEIRKYEHLKGSEKFTNVRYMDAISFMLSNRAQLTRINNMVDFIKQSQTTKSKLYLKVNLYEDIVNSFFAQTGKKISIKTGKLKIEVNGKDIEVSNLSSGETQIITLFAHIIFNRRMLSKASFMIDEPELSLHLAWQEMFVESLKRANADLQVILATHSPAIIKGMDDKCVFVNENK